MKTKKVRLLEKENEKEESNIKKEITSWWDALGLKIDYFNHAVELDQKLLDLEIEVKCWHDKYDLKNKDNHNLQLRIRALEDHIDNLKIESAEREKTINKNKIEKYEKKIKELKERQSQLEETNGILKSAQRENEKIIKGLSEQVNKKHRRKPQIKLTSENLEEVKLWEAGKTVALKKLRERNK